VIISRFVPAPTGFVHLGHVVNAAYVWGTAHRLNGRVLLRIEDHDRVRCRPEYEAAMLEDLEWLLGRAEPPEFLHHPLIMKWATQKLSKSDCDTGIRDLRAKDWTPGRVIGRACELAGLISEPGTSRLTRCRLLLAAVARAFPLDCAHGPERGRRGRRAHGA
jgi:glutamyl/glutaminyl-tRNA synthetase